MIDLKYINIKLEKIYKKNSLSGFSHWMMQGIHDYFFSNPTLQSIFKPIYVLIEMRFSLQIILKIHRRSS